MTAVGLLPIAASGADIKALMEGANAARKEYSSSKISENEAYQYAALRNILYRKGYTTEILANYEPSLQYFSEWWKQLAGESEGKDQRGIYPTSANFSTDLHSLGQFIQEGTRNLFETVVRVEKPRKNVIIPELEEDLDGLGYLQGKDVDFVNKKQQTVFFLLTQMVMCQTCSSLFLNKMPLHWVTSSTSLKLLSPFQVT